MRFSCGRKNLYGSIWGGEGWAGLSCNSRASTKSVENVVNGPETKMPSHRYYQRQNKADGRASDSPYKQAHQRRRTSEESINVLSISPDAISGVFGDLIAPVFPPGLPSLVQKVHQI